MGAVPKSSKLKVLLMFLKQSRQVEVPSYGNGFTHLIEGTLAVMASEENDCRVQPSRDSLAKSGAI